MNQDAIFGPILLHVGMVICLYPLLLARRVNAVRTKAAVISQFTKHPSEPSESLFIRNNIANQFELPILFYVLCLSLYLTEGVGPVVVTLAWLFSLSRIVHAAIHIGANRLRYRLPAFLFGAVMVLSLWVIMVLHLLSR